MKVRPNAAEQKQASSVIERDALRRIAEEAPHAVECHLRYAEEFPKDHDIECEGECSGCDCWKSRARA